MPADRFFAMTPSIDTLKNQARKLRADLNATGTPVTHGRALELIAHQHGYKDWNTLHASAAQPSGAPVAVGETVRGKYLGQQISGRVISLATRHKKGRWRITIELDKPVDVVRFDSFSSFRKRVSATINSSGVTIEKTSDGNPHLQLDLN